MTDPLTAYIVVCASPTCHWGPPLVVSLKRDIAKMAAEYRDEKSSVCGPHRVVEMVSAKGLDRLRKRLAQADADRNRLTGYAGAANAHYDAGCADSGCRVCDLVGKHRATLGYGVRRA